MYIDGLLTRNECIKAKKKILKDQSIPGCKKTETEEESTVTYITKKKKEPSKFITKKEKEPTKYITKKKQKIDIGKIAADAMKKGAESKFINRKKKKIDIAD